MTEGNACGAISWYFVQFPGFYQEIATSGFALLAMTVVEVGWSFFLSSIQEPRPFRNGVIIFVQTDEKRID